MAFDLEATRAQFPALFQEVNGKRLAYLDNGAQSQVPQSVVDAVVQAMTTDRSNIHRGVHAISQRATANYEAARKKVQEFIGAQSDKEILFCRGTTEAINLVANTFGRAQVQSGDEIVLSAMEHHANIVPWQMLAEEKGATLRVVPMDDRGVLDLQAYAALLTEKTRLVSLIHVSNALGTLNPIREMVALARDAGIATLVDGAQALPHLDVDVQDLGCDFYAFSGHKVFAPTGVGALYARAEILAQMPPWQGGGDMIRKVTFEKTTYAPPPARFEAGTPHIAGVVGLGAALDHLTGMDRAGARDHEATLLTRASEALGEIPGVRLVGTAPDKVGVLSFVIDGVHPHDVGTILDSEGVAVRSGHHCAQPVMDFFKVPATTRASFAFYNTSEDVDALVRGVHRAIEIFA
jgi:cysteine desulfurase/selenocysteine lyase